MPMQVALALIALAQIPTGKPPSMAMDPFLPADLLEVAEKASQAELDPKRGLGNALEILKAKRADVAREPARVQAIDLRVAATVLRSRFFGSTEFTPGERAVQALSTFSRLDLLEPGLPAWLDRAITNNPDAKKKVGKRGTWKMRAAILTRGSSLDRARVAKVFAAALEKVGARLEVVPAREAPMVITIGADDAPRENERDSAVKVTIGLQSIHNGQIEWQHSIYRVEAAKDASVALSSALEWIARIGGRDLFFRWLGENAFPALKDPTPRGYVKEPPTDKAVHAERPGIAPVGQSEQVPLKVRIPKAPGKEPPPPATPKR